MGDGPEFEIVGKRVLSEHAFLRLEELEVEGRGERFRRLRVFHPGAVAMIPVDGREVILINQYRAAAERDLLEIPAGTLDHDGEHLEDAVVRELQEEIGMRAATIRHVYDFYTAPGFTNEYMRLYLATDLTPVPTAPDGPEEAAARLERISISAVPGVLASGRVADAKTLVALHWLAARES